jgi:DNA processing protein
VGQNVAIDAIALSLAAGVGSRSARVLVEQFGSVSAVFTASRFDLMHAGMSRDQADAVLDRALPGRALAQYEAVMACGGEVVALGTADYPAALAAIHDPPAVLYCKGAWRDCLAGPPVVAVVGARRASTYGRNVARRIAADLAARGVTVLSGLARGIDAAAHWGALDASGRSVAVMGTGLDAVYPADHRQLAVSLLERGAHVSEFPMHTPPASQNFPFRNRVISGLSHGVLVVEAAERSGSLITARLALEQGRDVWAVPGNITSGTSQGSNLLIRDGARLVQSWVDIVEELPAEHREPILSAERARRAVPGQLPGTARLSRDEVLLLRLLRPDQPTHQDELAAASQLRPGALAEALIALEVRGLIVALPGGFFARTVQHGLLRARVPG